jgi:hypothetical protein
MFPRRINASVLRYLQKRRATRDVKIARGKGMFNSVPLGIA